MSFLHTLTLTKNNTGQNQFSFYEQVENGNVFLKTIDVQLNDSIELTTQDVDNTFMIITPNDNEDFTFTSSSIDV